MTTLQLESLSVKIGRLPIVRDATLRVEQGVVCGLVGANGAGKTTLMRGLMGALEVSGSARFGDVDLVRMPPHRRVFAGIGYMPGDRQLVPELTVAENIELPAWSTGRQDTKARLDQIYHLIPELRVAASRRCPSLSGGQQKLVALGRAMMAGDRLLLLDEPFEGLAPVLVQRLSEILLKLKETGVSILISDSYETHLQGLVHTTYHIERGIVHAPKDDRIPA